MGITYCTEPESGRHYRVLSLTNYSDDLENCWHRIGDDMAVELGGEVTEETRELAPGIWGTVIVSESGEADPNATHCGYLAFDGGNDDE